MLLQAFVLIATMVVLAGVLLTSTLASAHAAFHEMILTKTHTATSDATARFATWAQDQVVRYGTEQSWPTTPQPTNRDKTVGITTPVCNGTPSAVGSATPCAMTATMRWNVTGWSASANGSQRASTTASNATNLSTTLHEQRISATITVVISNATSNVIYATHSRTVTARIFDAYPYVAVTALRDASSEDLTAGAMEGDTGGTQDSRVTLRSAAPDKRRPASVTDTIITTTIDCNNSLSNDDQTRPLADSNAATFLRTRNVGNLSWVYEAPCSPTYASHINAISAPIDYRQATGNVYLNDTTSPTNVWLKGEHGADSFTK